MAKYNREFLVPYLESICALHIAGLKVEQRADKMLEEDEQLLNKLNRLRAPSAPVLEDTVMPQVGVIVGLILFIVSLLDFFLFPVLWGVVGFIIVILSIINYCKAKSSNTDKELSYEHAYERYSSEWDKCKKAFDTHNKYITTECEKCDKELERINATLESVYNVNIIPRKYRDMYVAVYLYDWFSTSMADDLDMALNMYVLEEIKDRLDRIIDMLYESLVNQRMMLYNQQKTLEQQEQYHTDMIDKLNRLQLSAAEHSAYLGMIEANTSAIAYFSAAEYIRKL